MKVGDRAFEGLTKDQRNRLLHKIAGLPDDANVNTYVQGVLDGRDLERKRANPINVFPAFL